MFMRRRLFMFAPDEPGGGPAPAETDTAIVEPTTGGEPTQEEVDWRKRAEDAQAWGTKTAQENAEYRSLLDDEEAFRRHAQEKFGYSFVDPEPELDFTDDPLAALREELRQEFRSELSQRDEQAQQAQQIAQGEQYIAASIAAINAERGTPLNARDEKFVVATALTSPAGADGMPDVMGAYKELAERDQEAMQQWASTKRTTHRVSPSGGAGEAVPDKATHGGRVELMMTQLQDSAS